MHTVSDGVGNFELAGVPEGVYTIIIESNHVKDNYSQKLMDYGFNDQGR